MILKGYSTKQILDPNYFMPDDYNELIKIYRTLAKSADQRLVRLEAYQHDKNFKTATKWAYARAMHDIMQWSGSEATRFNTAPPKDKIDLISKIQDIKHFLESPTSTKQGIISVYKKRADTINKNNGTNFSWQDLAQYFDSSLNEKLDEKYGSKTAMIVFNTIKKNKDDVIKDIEEKKNKHQKVEDEMLDIVVNQVLNEFPDDVLNILKKLS